MSVSKSKGARRAAFVTALVVVVGAAAAAGCDSKEGAVSKQEQSAFKGGPMPESARKIMAEKMRAAGANGAPGTPGATAPPTGKPQ